ncbi:CoA transferase [Novosphingobium pentaromativorans]|uniref:L-carnitine dehydratase/bile acid-inducible protein F n=1 Tax=Novosphingobium pentaromativorans US6-1 TaxID=1088721 RepID=G6E829_9SPHN|nr:CoA transferase [Novosphingobium pentaromativorans]AIT81462.1 carnitine dehydratase [Novosphingobium pentaromativorans US6-1]EHJ62672.1 L-carnitine dehydratase/bile acid-inducible protein F [Novosphingobium pentaromativorans US6-1]
MYNLLSGLTVVEGAAFIAGPSCTLHMAQMGATVIRFDQIGGGPDSARWPIGPKGQSLYWEGLNKGKKSLAINLSDPAGRELAQRVATSGDGLFVTNFPVSGFLSYEKLSALRDDLVCLRVMGWADGTPAVDYTINASVGLPWLTGHPDDPRPVNHVLPAWDLLAGAYGAFALLAAERERQASGKGREVRLALSDLAAATMGNLGNVAETLLSGGDRPRSGNNLFGAFGRDFGTADGERVMIVAITPRQWTGLIKALGIAGDIAALESELGVDFASDEGARFTHRARVDALVEGALSKLPLSACAEVFDSTGCTWSIYRTLSQSLAQEPRLFGENPIFGEVTHAGGDCYPTPGAAARIPAEERFPAAASPSIGQHSDEILATLLGMGSGEIGKLHDAGIISGAKA